MTIPSQKETGHIMVRISSRRRAAATTVLVLSGVLLAACAQAPLSEDLSPGADSVDEVTVALDWLAQPSNAGFFVAEANGYYEEAGINLTIQPGGTSASSVQVVAGGGAQFGLEYGTQILQARAQDIDIVSIAATLQTTPSVYVFHDGEDVQSLADLNGRTVYTQPSSAEWEYTVGKYDLTDATALQFQGSYAAFAADQTAVAQGYATSTPAQLDAQGIAVQSIKADSADINYGSSLFTTRQLIESDPDLVKRFIEATAKGWSDIEKDPEAAAEILKEQDQDTSVEDLTAQFKAQEEYIFTGDAATHQYGWQTEQRWDAIAQLALDWGIISDTSALDGAWTTDFLPAS